MTAGVPVVTVVVPARDEASDIVACLEAIAAQDHPVNRLEVLVVDGRSSDGTADIARRALGSWGFGSTAVITNDGAITSSNLNVGLAKASGEIVCRVDARTRIEPHYVRTCVELLTSRPELAVVGGAQVAIARDATARAHGIARALNNRWSMGGSAYRRATRSGPSDTVYLGAFRRHELVDAGGWDEQLVSNQDFDLNRRMSRRGTVWFEASLRSGYVPRPSLRSLWRQYVRFGRAKVQYWRTTSTRPERRQWALLVAPPLALIAAALMAASFGWSTAALAGLAIVAAAGALAIEVLGSDRPRAGVAGHLYGVAAMAVIAAGWWFGVVAGTISARGPEEAGAERATGGRASGAPPGA